MNLIHTIKSHPRFLKSNGAVNNHYIKTNEFNQSELKQAIFSTTYFLDSDIKLSERVKYVLLGLTEQKTCLVCSNVLAEVKLTYCSNKCVNKSKIVKENRIKTNISKFGFSSASKSKIIKEKTKITNKERYNGHYTKTKEFKEKQKRTCLERYGDKNFNNRKKARNTWENNNNGIHFNQKHITTEVLGKLSNKEYLIEQHHIQKKSLLGISKELKVTDKTVWNYFQKHNIEVRHYNNSYPEKQLVKYIETKYNTEIITSNRSIIKPYELDIYLPEYNLAIEFNGIFWHNPNRYGSKIQWFLYHQNKIELCNLKNIQLLHLWEDYLDHHELIDKAINGYIENRLDVVYKELYEFRTINILKEDLIYGFF